MESRNRNILVWIQMEGRSCICILVDVLCLILLLLMDESLEFQFLSQVRRFLIRVCC